VEFIFSYIKRNVKIAFKSVIFHYKQYICFFIAVFVVQMFFGIITMSSDTSNDIEFKLVNEEYDYHLVLKDLNSAQYVTIVNDEYTVFKNDHVHDIVRTKQRDEPGSYDSKYDVYIYLLNDPAESFRILNIRYFSELAALNEDGLRYSFSPLYNFNDNLRANTIFYVCFAVLITAVSVFLMMSLYNIRLNHFKFTYGIYMTFGADFKKLVETSFWEMMTVAGLTYVPAALCSYLANLIIYTAAGQEFTFYPESSLTKMFAFSFIIAAVSVILPMLRLSRRTPMSLIISEDNSNLVTSPRVSSEIVGMQLPGRYERLSLWRFRKYIVQLVMTAGIFCVLTMCGLFYSYMYNVELAYEMPQFTLHFRTVTDNPERDYTYTDELRAEVEAIEGVTLTYAGKEIASPDHILISEDDILPFTGTAYYGKDESYRATNFVECYSLRRDDIDYFERFEYSGEPMKLFDDAKNIIISDSFDNSRSFDFEPGDKIKICVGATNTAKAPDNLSGHRLLKWKLERINYLYEEYTIVAVLHNYPSFENMPFFVGDLYGGDLRPRSVDVYVDESLDVIQTEQVHEQLRDWAEPFGNVSVFNTHRKGLTTIEFAKQKYTVYVTVSLLILIIAPLIWFFSQTLFYGKRENEYTILQAFGAIRSEIRKLFVYDAVFCGIAGAVFCILMDLIGVFLIYKLVNVVLPYFMNISVRYDFYLPIIPFLLSILTSGICGFLSTYLPWKRYSKKLDTEVPAEVLSDE